MIVLGCRINWLLFLALIVFIAGSAKLGAGAAPDPGPPVFPLKVSANKRYLVDQNNVPFLIVGDTPQGLMGRLTGHDAEIYFADRDAHGFNTAGWIDVTCAMTIPIMSMPQLPTESGLLRIRFGRNRLPALRFGQAQ